MRRVWLQTKYLPFLILGLVLAGVVIALAVGDTSYNHKQTSAAPKTAQNTSCGPYRKDGVVTMNNHQFNVEIAYSTQAKEKGLSGRPCIKSDWGMLFDFGHDGEYAIWMKGMEFPIDVIWINSSHYVVADEIDFQPSTYDKQQPEKSERRANQNPARYVLEIKANLSKEIKIGIGTPVHFQKTQSQSI